MDHLGIRRAQIVGYLKAVMLQLQLVVVDGASHMQTPGRPEFVAALDAFLAAHAGQAG